MQWFIVHCKLLFHIRTIPKNATALVSTLNPTRAWLTSRRRTLLNLSHTSLIWMWEGSLRQKLNSTILVVLQAALLPLFVGAFGQCAHSLQALLQCHDALISAALEPLPATVMDSLATNVQLTPMTDSRKTFLLHCQAGFVKEMQAAVTTQINLLGSKFCKGLDVIECK